MRWSRGWYGAWRRPGAWTTPGGARSSWPSRRTRSSTSCPPRRRATPCATALPTPWSGAASPWRKARAGRYFTLACWPPASCWAASSTRCCDASCRRGRRKRSSPGGDPHAGAGPYGPAGGVDYSRADRAGAGLRCETDPGDRILAGAGDQGVQAQPQGRHERRPADHAPARRPAAYLEPPLVGRPEAPKRLTLAGGFGSEQLAAAIHDLGIGAQRLNELL